MYTKYAKIRTKIRKQTYRGSIFCEKGGKSYGKKEQGEFVIGAMGSFLDCYSTGMDFAGVCEEDVIPDDEGDFVLIVLSREIFAEWRNVEWY